MKNPYTGETLHHERPPYRRLEDYGFLALLVLGALYILAYVWVWWPVSVHLQNSGIAVGFVYGFLGGYGFLRSRALRAHHEAGSNAWLAAAVIPVALWDVASPFVLGDLHPLSVGAHVVGGALALLASSTAFLQARHEAGEEVRSDVH